MKTNFKSKYEEEGFWLGDNMTWTAENTYHTYLHILQSASCQEPSQGGGGGGPAPPPPPPPPPAGGGGGGCAPPTPSP